MNGYIFVMKTRTLALLCCSAAWAAFVLAGCSAGERAAQETRTTKERDRALRHFIDGSVFELNGDYARAVLEYQDALREERDPAILHALARSYSALGKHTIALAAGRDAVALDPDNLEYRTTLARAHLAALQIDSAAAQYEEITRRHPASVEAWYDLARLYQGRRPLKALEVYSSILERFGPEWDVLLQIAEIRSALGQHTEAAQALARMLDLDPGNRPLKQNLAQAYVRADSLDAALTLLRELRESDPSDLAVRADIAAIHLRRKDYPLAAEEFAPVLAGDSVAVDVKLRIGELYFQALERDSSLAGVTAGIFRRIRDAHPEDWRAYWFLGGIGALAKDDSLAEQNFRRVTELAGWNADAWVYLSSVFLERNDYAEVVTVLESALRAAPDDFRVNFFLGVAYARLGRTADALHVLERARTINPSDVNAIIQLALVHEGLGNTAETDRLYEEALTVEPDNHLVQNNYSYSLAERDIRLDRAYALARQAVEAQPENASYLDTLGWVYYRMGRFEEAERYIRQAIEAGEPSAILHEHLGDVYAAMNDPARALEQWSIALDLDSSNSALREKIERGTP